MGTFRCARKVVLLAVVGLLCTLAPTGVARGEETPPRSAGVWEAVEVGASTITWKVQIGTGYHTWWRDYLLLGVRVMGTDPHGTADQNMDGHADFDAQHGGPYLEAQFDAGLPLYWRLRSTWARVIAGWSNGGITDVADVVQVSLVSGMRLAISRELQTAVPIGLRWSKHSIMESRFSHAYKERWVQLRALLFAPGQRIGIDGEAMWMPYRHVGFVAFAEWIPSLRDIDGHLTCSGFPASQSCIPRTPINTFNLFPEQSQFSAGIRLRVTFAK